MALEGPLQDAFKARADVLSPLDMFREEAFEMLSPEARLLNFVENTYIRALMSGDDDTVIAGIRVNLAGRNEGDGVSASARMVRRMLDQMLVQQISADLERLREIEAELAELRAEAEAIEEQYLTLDERTQRPDESDQEFFERKRRLMEAKVASGEMSQADFDRWLETQEQIAALEQEREQILQRLRDYDAEVLAYQELRRHHEELLEQMSDLDARVDHNENGLARLQQIRAMSADQASQALDVLLVDYPDIAIDFPDGADVYERIDIIEQAIALDSDEARAEQVEIQEEIEVNQASTDTIIRANGGQIDFENVEQEFAQTYGNYTSGVQIAGSTSEPGLPNESFGL